MLRRIVDIHIAGFVCFLLLCTEGTLLAADSETAADAATNPRFDSKSFWYHRVDKDPVDPDSRKLVTAFLSQLPADHKAVGINTTQYACPVYLASDNDPKVAVDLTNEFCFKPSDFTKLQADLRSVPIPEKAEPADGYDSEIAIYQRSTDTLWELERASHDKVNHRWSAAWGGRMQQASKNSGIWTNPFGATATGLPFAGGQITPEELQRGEINHVIGIALVHAASDRYCWPAMRTDGDGASPIPEGARFRLDPKLDLDQFRMHRVAKIIAIAAQRYGFVVWDKASTVSLRAKNPKSYTCVGNDEPYCKLFSPAGQWGVLDAFPWEKTEFLKCDSTTREPPAPDQDSVAQSRRVDELLNRCFSSSGPGAAVAVIKDGAIVHQKGYGLARLGPRQTPITQSTNFRLASMTKQFTGMAVAMLMEQGKLKADERLAHLFPEQPAKEVTVDHLLHHTSGLRNYDDLFYDYGMVPNLDFRSWDSPHSFFEPTNVDVLSILRTQSLSDTPPGRVFRYNNTGYACLAAIVEKASGMCFREFLRQNIFARLGMSHTYIGDGRNPPDPRMAFSYSSGGAAARTDIDYSPLNRIYGEDGVFSNLVDLYLWDQALYPSNQRAPGTPQLVSDNMLKTVFRPTVTADNGDGYGYGWFATWDGNIVYHDGDWAGYRTYILRYPNNHFTVIVLSNSATADPAAIAWEIKNIYHLPTIAPRGMMLRIKGDASSRSPRQ